MANIYLNTDGLELYKSTNGTNWTMIIGSSPYALVINTYYKLTAAVAAPASGQIFAGWTLINNIDDIIQLSSQANNEITFNTLNQTWEYPEDITIYIKANYEDEDNFLLNKRGLKDVVNRLRHEFVSKDNDDFVKKTGDTMTGALIIDTKNKFKLGDPENKPNGLVIGQNIDQIGGIGSVAITAPDIVENSSDGSWADWGLTLATGHGSVAHGFNIVASGWGATAEGFGNYSLQTVSLSGEANSLTYTFTSYFGGCKTNDYIIDTTSKIILAIVTNVVKDGSNYTITLNKTLNAENAISQVEYLYISPNAIGRFSHTEGKSTIATGECGHAEGYQTIAGGGNSHAEGCQTETYGSYSHAEGCRTEAHGSNSHAEGYGTLTTPIANGNHAEGRYAVSVGDYSHAEGFGNADGFSTDFIDFTGDKNATTYTYYAQHGRDISEVNNFLQIGQIVKGRSEATVNAWATITAINTSNTTITVDKTLSSKKAITKLQMQVCNKQGNAYGLYSHTEGNSTQAWGRSQHAAGEYNIADLTGSPNNRGTYAEIIGNGTADNTRSNAATIAWNGEAWFAGDIYTGSTSGTNKDSGSKKVATEEYVRNLLEEFARANNLPMPE